MATSLKHTISTKDKDGNSLFISIRLDDDCKNGHQDFAITCSAYEKGQVTADRYFLYGGCCHDEILKVMPKLKPFVELHLSDCKGAPMYPEANGFYHLKNSGKATVIDCLRITEDEFNILKDSEDQNHFHYLLHSLNIPAKWETEANEAIKLLESMTGEKFENNSTRYQYTPPTDEFIKDMEKKLLTGYYDKDRIIARKLEKENAAIQAKKDSLKETRDKAILTAKNDYNVQIAVINAGLSIDNFIYYNHNNEGVFNWNTSSFNKAITQDEFNSFMAKVDLTGLPEGITFKIK